MSRALNATYSCRSAVSRSMAARIAQLMVACQAVRRCICDPADDGHGAQAVAAWRYEGEYAFYDADADEEDLAELLDPASWGTKYYAVDGDYLVGFLAFDVRDDATGIGLGLRPDLTGQGLGRSSWPPGCASRPSASALPRVHPHRRGVQRARTARLRAGRIPRGHALRAAGQRRPAPVRPDGARPGAHGGADLGRVGALADTHRVVFACGATEHTGRTSRSPLTR